MQQQVPKMCKIPSRNLQHLLKVTLQHTQLFVKTCNSNKQTHTHTHTHAWRWALWGIWLECESVNKACGRERGGSSPPECCYSGPHASASVSANERNSAPFHLVSLDQELASPKTARGTEGGRESHRHGRRVRGKCGEKISVMDRKRGSLEEERGSADREVNINTNCLDVPSTHAAAYWQDSVKWADSP